MDRLKQLATVLEQKNLDGFLVTNPTNIFYLTGFKGLLSTDREAYLVFSAGKATLTTARLYQAEAKELQTKNLDIAIARERNEMLEIVTSLIAHPRGTLGRVYPDEGRDLAHHAGVRIGFEENDLKYSEYVELQKHFVSSSRMRGSDSRRSLSRIDSRLRGNDKTRGGNDKLSDRNDKIRDVTLIPTENLVENLRMIKTQDEIKKIEKAQIISQYAFDEILKTIKVGQTEEEIADKLSAIIKSLGGEGLAFESIIASGSNSGRPHHKTGNRRLSTNDTLIMDFGAKFQNYHADLSRTIFVGKANDRQKNIYRHVKKAQSQTLTKIRYGVKLAETYHFANNHFKKHKLDEYFLHSLGHGIGLEIHEEPYLRSLPTTNYQLLTNGMVFSVEPGLYFPWGGVRIEDLVVIENGRAKVLGKLQEEIIEI